MDKQLGFYFNARRCAQCFACEIACKLTKDIETGPRLRRVLNRWEDRRPGSADWNLAVSCLHCQNPSCMKVCPTSAISKRAQDGIVTVKAMDCIACGACAEACPYGAPQFGNDGKMLLCDLCIERLEAGKKPACVSTCPGEALDFGPMEELIKRAARESGGKLIGANDPSFVVVSPDPEQTPQQYVEKFFRRTEDLERGVF